MTKTLGKELERQEAWLDKKRSKNPAGLAGHSGTAGQADLSWSRSVMAVPHSGVLVTLQPRRGVGFSNFYSLPCRNVALFRWLQEKQNFAFPFSIYRVVFILQVVYPQVFSTQPESSGVRNQEAQ